ncbi:MAG: MFS transporter [Alicyclobacillus sp.]|nr:MFS transporter [Alicyclobacillus sp.]
MPNHRRDQRMLWALGLGGFLVNADNRAIAPMLPAIAVALHTSSAAAGLLVTAYSIPYGLFQLIYGPIADRIGKVSTILISLCLFAAGTVVCGVVHTFPALMALRVVTGMFAAGIIPTTLAQIGDRFEMRERPRAIAFFMSLSTSGQAMGIVIGGLAAQFVSYRVLFLVLGIAAIPTLLAMLRQRTQPSLPRSPGESGGAEQEGTRGRMEARPLPLRERYRAIARQRRAWLVYGLVCCEGLVFYGGFTYLGVYGVTTLHLQYLVVGLLTATYSAGAFFGSRTITRVLQRVGSTRMPVFGASLMTAGFVLVWAWQSLLGLTLGFVVLGFGFSYCHSTLQTYATDLLPGGRATAVSLFAFSLFLGSGLGPILFGDILDSSGMHAMLASVMVAMAAFGAVCLTLTRRGRGAGAGTSAGTGTGAQA